MAEKLDILIVGAAPAAESLPAVGARVAHKVFGAGTVEACDAGKGTCRVKFDGLPTARWLAASVLSGEV